MRKITNGIVVALVVCAFVLCVGCSTPAASGSSAASTSAAASLSTSSEAPAVASEQANSASAVAVDPANLADGEYTIEVTLQGGSGKATVESPAKLIVEEGAMTAVIVWSSPNYDQMIVDGQDYFPVPRGGNSTFDIPVSALDTDLPVQAETTAMSEPHMIDYTLHFDSSTIQQ